MIFGTHRQYNPRPKSVWRRMEQERDFLKYVAELKPSRMNIFSLALDDDLGFGVFAMQEFGTEQYVTWTSYTDDRSTAQVSRSTPVGCGNLAEVERWLEAGFRITACGARHDTFYYVMTAGAKGFEGMRQRCILRATWAEVEAELKHTAGMVMTGICYSMKLGIYLVVTTESSAKQRRWWRDSGMDHDYTWLDDLCQKGFHQTIYFRCPRTKKVLDVVTEDKNILGCSIYKGYTIERYYQNV